MDRAAWPDFKERLAKVFKEKTRDEWCELLEGTDVCLAPVLSLADAPAHPHNVERSTFVEIAGIPQPGPAPRFSRTECEVPEPPAHAGEHTGEILADAGYSASEIAEMREAAVIA